MAGTSWSAARHRSGAAPPPLARLIRPLHSPISLFPLLALACLTPPPHAAARILLRPTPRAPPPAARGLAGRCSAARRLAGRRKGDPPRGGSLAAARGTRPGRRPPPSPGPACSGRPRPRRPPRPPSRRHLLLRPPRNLRVASAMQTNALRGYERGEAALSARGPASRWLPGRSPARESMMAQHCLPVTHPVARLRKFFRRAVTSLIPSTQPWTWDESALARGAYTPCAQPPPHCPPPQLFHLAKLPLSPVNDAGERWSGARMQVTRRNATAGCC